MRKINLLSVAVPCHNEEEVLSATHRRLTIVLEGLVEKGKCGNYELIYVDNGSTDNTLEVIEKIFQNDKHVKIIVLRRNFGYQGSISAGLYYSQGEAVVAIDADLQDPPEKIGEMIDWFNKGYDLVLGVRSSRLSDSFFKRFFAQSYYRLIKLMGVEIVYNHGDFRLMARVLVDEFNALTERNRFIRAMILRLDSKYAVVYYERQPRQVGKTKFKIKELVSLSIDGITSFSYIPLRLTSILGILVCLSSLVAIIWTLYMKMADRGIPGWASTLLPIFAFGGLQLLVLGIMGEYMGRLYMEVKQRPVFTVREEFIHKELAEKNNKNNESDSFCQ